MSTERLVGSLAEQMDRRGLGKLGASTLAAVAGLMRLVQRASAESHPCNLCPPGDQGTCSNCQCVWCWVGVQDGNQVDCCECYGHGRPCDGFCEGVICSWVRDY